MGVFKFVSFPAIENSLFDLIYSSSTLLYFLFYLAFSISLTSASILYKYFKSDSKKYDQEYLNLVKNFALKTGLIFTFVQPLLFVLSFLSSSKSALSFEVFIIAAITLSLMLVISIMFYIMYKESKMNLGGSTVLVILILAATLIHQDQLAFETNNQVSIYEQGKAYNLFTTKIKEDAGINEIIVISGEDIYNGKCIACHRFDTKLVGPAYQDVLPKYEGKRADLIEFILNPRKIDPEFTAMPNQGLKPKEAEAIADYIVKMYELNKK